MKTGKDVFVTEKQIVRQEKTYLFEKCNKCLKKKQTDIFEHDAIL